LLKFSFYKLNKRTICKLYNSIIELILIFSFSAFRYIFITVICYFSICSSYIIAIYQIEQYKLDFKIYYCLFRAYTRIFQKQIKYCLYTAILRLLQLAIEIVYKEIGIDIWIVIQYIETSINCYISRYIYTVDSNTVLYYFTENAADFKQEKTHNFINADTKIAEKTKCRVVNLFYWYNTEIYLFCSFVKNDRILELIENCCNNSKTHNIAICSY